MKAIMVMFDTLNRHMLSPYGGPEWMKTPNFQRMSEHSAVFQNSYIGSMPCMPARRELHTGRHNFLHRGWGPLEPFDDSAIEQLGEAGVYTHLVTDHQHYWEDGGGTYHPRYRSFELIRGQEGDPWKGEVADDDNSEPIHKVQGHRKKLARQDRINRKYIQEEEQFPQARTFAKGLEFIRQNADADRWFLQLETFDPHEPFYSPLSFQQRFPDLKLKHGSDWPDYGPVVESDEEVEQMRYRYAALLSMCDEYLGKVLDTMDELNLWHDTMLIVNTDHGFLLGEHGQWAKNVQPFYNEIAHTPLFIWDPRSEIKGESRNSLVQMIDLPATLLDYFGLEKPADMQGTPLTDVIANDTEIREAALFGVHGGHVCVTDGRYVYMRGAINADNQPLFEYTLMPTRMNSRFRPEELEHMKLTAPFPFTKEVSVLQIPSYAGSHLYQYGTLLYDLAEDPYQQHPIQNDELEERMIHLLKQLMKDNDAPSEQYERLGLV